MASLLALFLVACTSILQEETDPLSSAEENFSLDLSSMPAHSSPSEVPVELLIENQSLQAIEVIWVDYEGQESFSKILSAGFMLRIDTFQKQLWHFRAATNGEWLYARYIEGPE